MHSFLLIISLSTSCIGAHRHPTPRRVRVLLSLLFCLDINLLTEKTRFGCHQRLIDIFRRVQVGHCEVVLYVRFGVLVGHRSRRQDVYVKGRQSAIRKAASHSTRYRVSFLIVIKESRDDGSFSWISPPEADTFLTGLILQKGASSGYCGCKAKWQQQRQGFGVDSFLESDVQQPYVNLCAVSDTQRCET